jgi:hypothetical protein
VEAGADWIVNVIADDVPPPGEGFTTVTNAVPADATSLAGMAAVSCDVLTSVVVRAAPLQFTVDPTTNPDPVTVSVNAASPTVTEAGDRAVSTGTGFLLLLSLSRRSP